MSYKKYLTPSQWEIYQKTQRGRKLKSNMSFKLTNEDHGVPRLLTVFVEESETPKSKSPLILYSSLETFEINVVTLPNFFNFKATTAHGNSICVPFEKTNAKLLNSDLLVKNPLGLEIELRVVSEHKVYTIKLADTAKIDQKKAFIHCVYNIWGTTPPISPASSTDSSSISDVAICEELSHSGSSTGDDVGSINSNEDDQQNVNCIFLSFLF